ncbi:TPA: MFS transporter [Candidatus Bathyarchaeota archaeon]|nr:MFS transporter [Candidatus Bathyarchaeota archaeon]
MPLDGPLRYFLCGMALHSLGLNVLTSYVALYASVALGMDNVRVGTLVSLWNLGLLFQILWGRFADRFGALLTISAHVVLSNVTWLLYPSSSGFHTASLAMLLFGLVGAMDMPARKTIAAQLSPPSSRGTAMGLVDFSTGIVASAGSVIGGLAWDYMGYYSPFLLGVVINLLATPFLFAVYRALSRGTDKAMGAKAPRRTRREQSTRLMQLDVVDPASYDHGVSLTRKGSRFSPILLD